MEIGPGLQLWVGNSSASEQHSLQHSNGPISFKDFHVTQPYAFPVDQLSGLELELESDSEVGVDSGPNWIDDPFPIDRNGLCVSPRPNRATSELLDDPESPRPLVMDMDPPEDLAHNEAVDSNLVDSANTELGPKEEKEHKKDAEASPVRQSPVAYDPIALGCNSDEQHREVECAPNSDLPSVLTPEVQERPQTPTAITSDGFDDRASCGTLQAAAGQLSPTSSPGLKAYVHCSLCNRTFRDKRSLNIHITKTHSNTKVIFGNNHNTDTGGLKLRLVSLPPTKRSRRSASIIEPQPPVSLRCVPRLPRTFAAMTYKSGVSDYPNIGHRDGLISGP
ncbi:unnamed protein product [Dicrocoelium dendriticum]|nr:unnamed protein product [Dicrocoelium dendriticum]